MIRVNFLLNRIILLCIELVEFIYMYFNVYVITLLQIPALYIKNKSTKKTNHELTDMCEV